MYIYVSKLKGLEGVPNDRTAISAWLSRHSITTVKHGHRFVVNLSDLPAPVRLAYVEREIEAAGLFGGTYDEEAHTNFMKMTPAMRDGAERKAEIARFLLSVGKLLPWSQKIALARKTFGESGTSEPSIARILKAVKGVDPVNFAPALLADYTLQGAPKTAKLRAMRARRPRRQIPTWQTRNLLLPWTPFHPKGHLSRPQTLRLLRDSLVAL